MDNQKISRNQAIAIMAKRTSISNAVSKAYSTPRPSNSRESRSSLDLLRKAAEIAGISNSKDKLTFAETVEDSLSDIQANFIGYQCAGWESLLPIISWGSFLWRESCECCCKRSYPK